MPALREGGGGRAQGERLAQVGPWLVAVGAALVTTVAFGMYPVVATAYLFDRLSPWFVYE